MIIFSVFEMNEKGTRLENHTREPYDTERDAMDRFWKAVETARHTANPVKYIVTTQGGKKLLELLVNKTY